MRQTFRISIRINFRKSRISIRINLRKPSISIRRNFRKPSILVRKIFRKPRISIRKIFRKPLISIRIKTVSRNYIKEFPKIIRSLDTEHHYWSGEKLVFRMTDVLVFDKNDKKVTKKTHARNPFTLNAPHQSIRFRQTVS